MATTFFHASAGTLALPSPLWPFTKRTAPRARVGRSDSGDVVVATLGSPDVFYELRFAGLTQSEVDALDAFLAAIDFQAEPFSWTDDSATVRTARLWQSDVTSSQAAPDVYDVTLNLLVQGS